MDKKQIITAFAALAQPTRIEALRLLVAQEPDGMAVGDLARALCVRGNTMSVHLAILARAGLVDAEKQSRSVIYRARLEDVRGLGSYLIDACCAGRPEACRPAYGETRTTGLV
ncbi:ArsR/SmtB family transcription factor [Zavarzinia compransoris]|uniref:Transcriptional regulator n=1 Tax=Zavarzinia compransoris TaxID=1264899 RepID=A0A317DWK1_9PROT|nr:metalloregulator ArsR/SmtB family transcription factor [Zavarzinia compransoris]PWR18330.1 transcriptional regulator [Zavarzinia compransoris]TDP43610.1 ArsR family transcriptional regulator [Zavarzinia compransoris]